MPLASYVDEGEAIDFTPVTAVAAGDVVVQGTLVGVARTALAAGRSGSLAVRGLFDVVKGATTFAAGAAVYWNPSGLPLGGTAANGAAVPTSTSVLLGYAVRAASAIDRTVRVAVVLPGLPGPQGIQGNPGPVGPAGPQGDPGPTGRPAGIKYEYIGDSDGPAPGQFSWSNSYGAYLFPVTDLEGNDQSPVWFALNQTTDGHFLFLTLEAGGPIARLDFPAASNGGSVFYLYVGNLGLTPGIYYAVPVIRGMNGEAGPEGPSWIPAPPGSGTWILKAIDGAVQWVEESWSSSS
jgi:predicted RecA/RadA family phage recombinase